nr:immunoglobulin light chain junction region [Macaca mulatta]
DYYCCSHRSGTTWVF